MNAKQIGALERQDESPARQARGCPAARASARAGGGLSTMTFQFGTFFPLHSGFESQLPLAAVSVYICIYYM